MNAIRRQLQSMLQVETRAAGFRARFTVGPELAVLPDHFRDYAILPGVCMVQAVLLAGAAAENVPDLRLKVLKNAKMMRPVRPGDEVVIEGDITRRADGDLAIKATVTGGGRRLAEFSLMARPAMAAEGTHL